MSNLSVLAFSECIMNMPSENPSMKGKTMLISVLRRVGALWSLVWGLVCSVILFPFIAVAAAQLDVILRENYEDRNSTMKVVNGVVEFVSCLAVGALIWAVSLFFFTIYAPSQWLEAIGWNIQPTIEYSVFWWETRVLVDIGLLESIPAYFEPAWYVYNVAATIIFLAIPVAAVLFSLEVVTTPHAGYRSPVIKRAIRWSTCMGYSI